MTQSRTIAKVATTFGSLRGSEEDGVLCFRGIPYARPPVGELRFRAPEPPEPWQGVKEALEFGPPAMQTAEPAARSVLSGMFGPDGRETSEDCLSLNVWTPGVDGGRRPVMVWIHGGGFTSGSGSTPLYDGAALARRGDVVVVTLNYRLGALGYLFLEELGGANFGMLDQVAALRWVREEIASFGGDPDEITVFGESAGGKSVETLLAMPAARGLFHRAILESTYDPPMEREAAIGSAEALLVELGLGAGDADRLRQLPARRLVEARDALQARALESGTAPPPFVPVVDGDVLPEHPRQAVASGVARSVPMLIGTNLDERASLGAVWREGLDDEKVSAALRLDLPDAERRREAIRSYREARGARGERAEPFDLLVAISTDRMFRFHSLEVAAAQARHQPRTYMYLFTWASSADEGRVGSCHALELPFVFGNLQTPLGRLADSDRPGAAGLAERMQDAWISFARSGDPGHPGLPPWPAYRAGIRPTMELGPECRALEAPMEAERLFWARGT